METSFTGKKDAIRFGVIGGAYLIDVLTHMACDGCTVFAHILHFFKDAARSSSGNARRKSFIGRAPLSV